MAGERVTVTFLPSGRRIAVLAGTSLLEAAVEAGLDIEGDCAGRGTCGKCRVQVVKGTPSPTTPAEERHLSSVTRREGWRLACQARVLGPLQVAAGRAVETRRKDALTRLRTEAPLVDADAEGHAVAVDIGTTTVVASLLDLSRGDALATASATNPQNIYGADVISRITHATTRPRGTRELQERVIEAINALLDDLIRRAGIGREQIRALTVVGNTTMTHLFLGVRPDGLSRAPYEATFTEARTVRAGDLGLAVPPTADVHVLPGIGGFLGADTVAVALATRLQELPGWTLALDIGTNGELLLAGDGRIWATSTAAGPAFEGAQISSGMRAVAGAIERVRLGDDDIVLQVIGGGPPLGICGSGLIDAVAALLQSGVLDPSGRLRTADELAGAPPALRDRVIRVDGQNAFVLARAADGPGPGAEAGPVLLTQGDIRQLQLGKGAILAGARLLLREVGIEESRLDRVLLAGAFGNYIDPASARRIGLLPDVPLSRIVPVGNAAGAGAQEAALSRRRRRQAEELARAIVHVPLAERPEFQGEFVRAMRFA